MHDTHLGEAKMGGALGSIWHELIKVWKLWKKTLIFYLTGGHPEDEMSVATNINKFQSRFEKSVQFYLEDEKQFFIGV